MKSEDLQPLERETYFGAINAIQSPKYMMIGHDKIKTCDSFIVTEEDGTISSFNLTHNPDINIRAFAAIEYLKESGQNQRLYSKILTRYIAMGRFLSTPAGEKVGLLNFEGNLILNPAVILASADFPVDVETKTFTQLGTYDSFISRVREVADTQGILME